LRSIFSRRKAAVPEFLTRKGTAKILSGFTRPTLISVFATSILGAGEELHDQRKKEAKKKSTKAGNAVFEKKRDMDSDNFRLGEIDKK
jgi:hypothetical protein